MDLALVDACKERKSDGFRIKERDVPRRVFTTLGEVSYKRTYFDNKSGEYAYLCDELIGVEAYERLSPELSATLVQKASEISMEKSARYLNVPVTRQSVNNKVLALKEVCVDAVPAEYTPPELHVFADEDHVHMKSGNHRIVPLVTVTEGIDASVKRHKTIHSIHFEGFGMDNQCLFENLSAFLYKRYDMEKVKKVYVHADGANWIKSAKQWLPNVHFVMDGFHLERQLRRLARIPGAVCRMATIRKALREDKFETFVDACAKIDDGLPEAEHEKLKECINFIQNHWEAIVLRFQEGMCGSCTEPLVSHVLSERLSRQPLAWSEHGLRQMAMLRVFVKNGGVVSATDIRVSRRKTELENDALQRKNGYAKYRILADKQIHELMSTRHDWSLLEPALRRSGKLDSVGLLKKAYGSLRDNFASA